MSKLRPGDKYKEIIMKNRDAGYYEVVYTCLNCGETLYTTVKYGKSIPKLVNKIPDNEFMAQFVELGPECEYCGCRDYSHGKRP